METVRNIDSTNPWETLPSHSPLPVIEGYEVIAMVGRGGMGKVYRARHITLGRTVAIKLLAQEPDEKLLARFREEARAVARLQHPHIAQLFETGIAQGRPFYAQEFLEGGSLAQKFAGQPQEPRGIAATVEIIARAIQHSHANGILHRDLKPANILLAADGTPKVTDFGLAKALVTPSAGDTPVDSGAGLTRTGEILGTPAYMPPEQASGVVSSFGPGSDVYGLGAILYEGLTGRPPFQSPEPLQTLVMVLSMEPVSPRALQPRVPKDLETICLKCLEKNPSRRYASARELADDLRRFLNGEPIVARPVGFIERTLKLARRKKTATALILVSAAALLLLMVAGSILSIGYFELERVNRDLGDRNQELAKVNSDLTDARDQTQQSNQKLARTNDELRDANRNVLLAKNETQRTLELTLASLDQYFFGFSDRLREVPGGEVLRRDILDEARNMLDRLGKLRPNDPTIRDYRATGYYKLSVAEDNLGRIAQARDALQSAQDVNAGLATEFPAVHNHRRRYALATLMLANKLIQLGDSSAAGPLYAEAVKLSDELLEQHPEDVSVLELAALVQYNRYGRSLTQGRDADAEKALRKVVDVRRRLASKKADPASSFDAFDAEMSLAGFLVMANQAAEADSLLTGVKDKLAAREPGSPSLQEKKLRATLHSNLAMLRQHQKQTKIAEQEYRTAALAYESLAAEFPRVPLFRLQAAENWFYHGNVAAFDMRAGEARPSYRKAIDMLEKLVKDYPTSLQYKSVLQRVQEQLRKLPPEKNP
jgi:serine/threonine protein kinase